MKAELQGDMGWDGWMTDIRPWPVSPFARLALNAMNVPHLYGVSPREQNGKDKTTSLLP